ncbi:MAG: translocation/assembly module TamB domain-containing protein [bacterium]|nr:translocation/assembly module TamB domain-containing protein [bacterium]
MLRKLFKILIYACVACVLLSLLAYLGRDPLRDTLVQAISTRLSKSFNGSLQIGKLRGTLLTSLVLQDIVLRDADGVVLQLDSVRLTYNLLTLLKRQVTVFRVDIVRPRLRLKQMADGTWNITRMFPSAAPPAAPSEPQMAVPGLPIGVRLMRLQIRHGQIMLQVPSLPGVRQIEGLNMQLAGHIDQAGWQMTLRRLTARVLPANVEIQTLGTLRGSPGHWQIDALRMRTGRTLMTLNGVLPGGSRVASLDFQLRPLDVTEIGRLLHNDALQGQVYVTLKAEGPADALVVRAQLNTEGGRIDLQSQLDLTASPLRYRGTLDVAHLNLAALVRRAALQSDINLGLHIDGAGLSPREMRGRVQFDIRSSQIGNIALRPSRIDLDAKPQHFQVRHFHLDTSVAQIRMSGAINLAGQSNLRYEVMADLAHLRQLLNIEALGGDIQLRGEVSGELQAINAHGVLQANHLLYRNNQLRTLQLTYNGVQLGAHPQIKAELVARQARLGALPVERLKLQATYHDATRQVQFSADVRQAPGYGGTTNGQVTLLEKGQEVVLESLVIHLVKRTWQAVAPLHFALGPDRIHIKQFRLVHGNESLQLSGALHAQHLQDLRLEAQQIDLSALRALVPLPEMIAGRATANVQVSGTLSAPLLRAEVSLQPGNRKDLPFKRLQATLAYAAKQLRGEVRISQSQGEILTAKLRLPVDMALVRLPLAQRLLDAPVVLHLQVNRPNLSALKRWQPTLPNLAGTVEGVLDLQGTYASLDLDARVQLRQFGLPGRLEQINAPLRLTANIVMATSVQALGDTLRQGRLTPIVRKLEVRMPSFRAQLPRPDAPPQPIHLQHLLLQAEGAWRPQGVQATLDLRVDASSFPLLPGLSSRLRARLDGGAVHLEQFRLQSVPATLEAQGTLSAARQLDLTYRLDLGDLKALQKPLGISLLQAKGGLSGYLKGPLDALQAYVKLQLDDWGVANLKGKTIRAVVSATTLPSKPRATIDVQLDDMQSPSLPPSSIRVAATYAAPRGTFTVGVVKGPYEQTRLAGQIVFQEEQRLTLDSLRLYGHGLRWENDGALELVRDASGAIQLRRLMLRSGEQEITAQGSLNAAGGVAGNLRLQRLQIQPLVHAVAPAVPTPDGQLALDLKLTGSVQQPQLEGQIELTALQWQQHSLGEIQGLIGFAKQTWRTDLRWQDQGTEVLHLHGAFGTGTAGALAVQVQSNAFDMRKLAPFSPAIIESAGSLMLDLRLAGTLQQPKIHGNLELREGVLQLAPTGERYRDIQVHLRFGGDRVDIARMQVGSRSGNLRLTGQIKHTGLQLQQVDLALQAQEFTAIHTHDMQAVLSAAVQVSGSLQDMLVSGNIAVPRARYRLTGKLGGGPAAVEPWELTVEGVYGLGPQAVAAGDGSVAVHHRQAPLPFLRTDLTVEILRNVWAQGAGTAIEIQGKLHVAKALQAPFIVSGTVRTVRGFTSFYGKKFVLQKGQVTFPGTEEINPFLDVTITHKVSDYVVSIQVEGKAKQPELTLSSDPELEQADIVSLLIFGKTTDRLTSSEQSALFSQTQAVAGRVAAGLLEKTVGKTLGLNTIEVEPGEALGTGRVGVGRYVTQDIFVTYERLLGGNGKVGNMVGVEYSLKGNLKVKSSSSDLGASAVDLLWSFDY